MSLKMDSAVKSISYTTQKFFQHDAVFSSSLTIFHCACAVSVSAIIATSGLESAVTFEVPVS